MGKRVKKVKRTLTYEERKAIAQDILENGLMLKQIADEMNNEENENV